MTDYHKPPELYQGLRLHQNENTAGCSPRVLEALAALGAEQIGVYPPYSEVIEACARYLGVDAEHLALVNGLDEGILAVAFGWLRPTDRGTPEAIIPDPAFEVTRIFAEAAGGRVVGVKPAPDFRFALDEVLAAITPATRAVFLTNPNNPTGVSIPRDAIRVVARRVPPEAIVFVDEAYISFGGETFVPELDAFPNVVVGRTFSKAHGLAGLRVGCVVASPRTLDPVRRILPVYSVNIAAVVALLAALKDTAYVDDYCRQVAESKTLLYAACDRLGLRYWRSDANFVLVRTGSQTDELVSGAEERGFYLRDRSTEPGCEGCVRITTGIVEHTRRFIAAMEEVLCAAR